MSTPSSRRAPVTGLLILLTLASAACAHLNRPAGTASPNALTLEVRNNLTPPTSLAVYVLSEGGTRSLLGTVNPGSTTSLTVNEPPVGQYRFLARTTEGSQIVSNPFSYRPGETLVWDLFSNLVTPKYSD